MRDPARVRAAFRERTGREAEGVWAAPGRVNLIGEHTDYNDGFVLPLAIDLGCLAAAARRDDGRVRLWSLQEDAAADLALADLRPGGVEGWAGYPAGVAWALRQRGVDLGGADIVLDADVPDGAGLSSSAALTCSTGLALSDLAGAGLDAEDVAAAARRAENEVVGAPTGMMDQMVSMLGRAGHALFLDTRSLERSQVALRLDEHGLGVMVIDTRAPHRLAASEYGERRRACEEAASVLGVPALRDATLEALEAHAGELGDVRLRRARHVVTEDARVLQAVELLRAGEPGELGPLLAASHASLRDDFEVSIAELDTAVEAALAAGAIGARLTGGGFGGSALALVPRGRQDDVRAAVEEGFARRSFRAPSVFAVEAADGARRVA